MDVLAHVCTVRDCGQMVDTSSNYCDSIQPYDMRRFCFCQMSHDFQIVLLEITTISYF